MWILLPLARSLAGRFVRAASATALGSAALVAVAALVEGHPPRLETLRALVVPLAGTLGACWALGGWRRDGADLAAASLGWRRGGALVGLVLLALPLLALGPPAADRPPEMVLRADRISARLPSGPVEWRWTATHVERRDAAGAVTLPLLPPPRARAAPASRSGPWWAAGSRALALLIGLGLLTFGAAPGPARVLAAATAAFAAGHGAVWLIG